MRRVRTDRAANPGQVPARAVGGGLRRREPRQAPRRVRRDHASPGIEPETTVVWEGERASGTVELEPRLGHEGHADRHRARAGGARTGAGARRGRGARAGAGARARARAPVAAAPMTADEMLAKSGLLLAHVRPAQGRRSAARRRPTPDRRRPRRCPCPTRPRPTPSPSPPLPEPSPLPARDPTPSRPRRPRPSRRSTSRRSSPGCSTPWARRITGRARADTPARRQGRKGRLAGAVAARPAGGRAVTLSTNQGLT